MSAPADHEKSLGTGQSAGVHALREAAQQALEALLKSHTCPLLPDDCEEAITALRAALEQEQAEPVAEDAKQQALDALNRMQSILMMSGGRHPRDVLRTYIQLTTAQPQRKPLTDDRLWELWNIDSDEAYKNCPTYFQEFRYVARIVERAHGIEEEAK